MPDKATNEMRVVEVVTQVRQWWFITENNQVVLHVKYGAKVIDIRKGKNSIEITEGHRRIKMLETMREDVSVGDLTHRSKVLH